MGTDCVAERGQQLAVIFSVIGRVDGGKAGVVSGQNELMQSAAEPYGQGIAAGRRVFVPSHHPFAKARGRQSVLGKQCTQIRREW